MGGRGMGGWGMALRIAWRDAVRHKVRSVLVLVLVALPVLAVSTGAIIGFTAEVRGVEALDRRLGAAQASLSAGEGAQPVVQMPDPDEGYSTQGEYDDGKAAEQPDVAGILEVLGEEPVSVRTGSGDLWQENGDRVHLELREGDFADPLLAEFVDLVDGRLPASSDEVVVTEALRALGHGIGDELPLTDLGVAPTVVGVVEDAEQIDLEIAYGPEGSLSLTSEPSSVEWFVGGEPVDWDAVLALNERGFVVTSRAVITDPPPDHLVEYEAHEATFEENAEALAVTAMIVAMVLIEIVLLAGPAFAVTARNHTRTLALVAASGGTPRQARRVILAGALVLGLTATAVGTLLSLPLAAALLPFLQRFSSTRFGPFDVPWEWLAVVAAFGLLSAFLAAVVPAWLTSRQDVVAALAGRRSDGAPRLRTPLAGVVVLGIGVACTTFGGLSYHDLGPLLMSGGAVISMLGMILVVPGLVAVVARTAGRLPLPLRYAARDAARHRTRTVPAVAAVAATVAGVVALGIANASDEKESRETHYYMAPVGTGVVTLGYDSWADGRPDWGEVRDAALREAPEADLVEVRGLLSAMDGTIESFWAVAPPRGEDGEEMPLLSESGGLYPSNVLVGDEPALDLTDSERIAMEEVLAEGKVALFTDQGVQVDSVELVRRSYDVEGVGEETSSDPITLPAATVPIADSAQVAAVVPESLAGELGDAVETLGLAVTSPVDRETQTAMERAVRGINPALTVEIERGYQRHPFAAVVLWVLGAVGGLLMLAGTLTATFLSLSDARPDLATVSAVGGSPRTRRAVAASYALVIAMVGAVLGAVVGFVPGIAVSRPLTSGYGPGPFLEIPWALIGAVVVLLPLLSAAIVWLTSRSRLPMVARID
ncbi:ABC transporter permease [Nocardioides jishulii]|uniref:FtsX-like permease family protein n=1 Tax=Nocardioides jishulii TaxID=2575440 RepID=A0A4U2YV43_9ACTN|nr:ABC transporter permease [Nocardioides jishulii]QCX26216.1 FtsX-like permease family protein [Nocardioides jishulii]TKI63981.1 FtsX-like permease family protein [Nocardioides jishulii]